MDSRDTGSNAGALLRAALRPYRLGLLVALGLMIAQSALALVNPWLAGKFAFAVLHRESLRDLMLAWFAILLLQAVVAYAVAVRRESIAAHLAADIGGGVFDRLQLLPLAWHHGRRRGDVLSLLLHDVDYLAEFVTATLVPLVPLVLTCVGALYMMARIEPWFALAAAILVPAVYVAMRLSGRRLRPLGKAVSDAYVARSVAAERTLALLPVVKAFTGEPQESERFAARARAFRDVNLRLVRANAIVAPLVRVVAAAAILALLWMASLEVTAGRLGADGMVSLLLYGLLLTQPVSALAGVYGHSHSAWAVAKRLGDVFAAATEPRGGSLAPARVRGAIAFDGVDFAYPGAVPILRGLDLDLAAGETIAITGVNGAGKTTLMRLLMRFVEPDAGSIRLDGHDLAEYNLAALRGQIGLVPQKVLLFDGTIEENIGYGRPDADHAAVERAARLAQAHDFIATLGDGYATRVGDDGVRLSGGQRQRIALARALLKDPAVLVFDEATAMFDPAAEAAFVAAFKAACGNRSVILVTHRPAGLALADRVLKLEHGRLVAVVPSVVPDATP